MHTTLPPNDHPGADGRRAGATWVAATGAFLLLAAAAVFIAVQWRTLPEVAKLALVATLTAAFLTGGRVLRRSLPSTGDVLFHLGAFLVPVDVAGVCVRLAAGWRSLLVAEGLVGVGFLGAMAGVTGSVVLGWAAAASVVVLALGTAAVCPLPAPLVLAAAAGAAHVLGRRRPAIAWATVAGAAPVLGAGAAAILAALAGRDLGSGVLEELGLAGTLAAWSAAVSGLACAIVLGREASRTRDLGLVAVSAFSVVGGAAAAWSATDPTTRMNEIAGPVVFVLLEAAALLAARDPFWKVPARAVALVGEVLAALAAPIAVVFVLAAPIVDEGLDFLVDAPPWSPDPAAATAFGLLAAGWVLAGWRRQGPHASLPMATRAALVEDRTVAFAAASVAAAVVVGSASTWVAAGFLLVLGAALAVGGGAVASIISIPLLVWSAVTLSLTHPTAVLPSAALGALVLAWSARRWIRTGNGAAGLLDTVAGGLLLLAAAAHGTEEGIGLPAALLVAVFTAWGMSAFVEGSWPASCVARAPMVAAVLLALGGRDVETLPVALAATLLLAVESLRTDDPRVGFGAAIPLAVAVASAAGAAGLSTAETGVALALAALVLGGISVVVAARWRPVLLAAAGTSLAAALPLAAGHPARFAEVVVVAGGLTIAAGMARRERVVMHAGGAIATLGIALHLVADGVSATEPFVLPIALQLAVAGWQARRADDAPSSWVAFGPSIALLGGAALVERIDGGGAWHAIVAGAVGVGAVGVGGWKRLAGPLFLGTGLVAGVTVLETLHTLAGVPTWGWLAAGGSVLLATGIALERGATSPTEAGRRLVDVVSDRFD